MDHEQDFLRRDDPIQRGGFLRRENQSRARLPEEKLPILRGVYVWGGVV